MKPEFPLQIPLTGKPPLSGGTEYKLSFEDLAKEIRKKRYLDETTVLRQVHINEDNTIGFVFDEGEL